MFLRALICIRIAAFVDTACGHACTRYWFYVGRVYHLVFSHCRDRCSIPARLELFLRFTRGPSDPGSAIFPFAVLEHAGPGTLRNIGEKWPETAKVRGVH